MTSIIIAAASLVGIFVVSPTIIQSSIDETRLTFTTVMNMTNPTDTSVVLSAGIAAVVSSPLAATMSAPGTAVEYFDPSYGAYRRFGSTRLPAVDIEPGQDATVNIPFQETVDIRDAAVWNDFIRLALMAETFELRFTSDDVRVKLGGPLAFVGLEYRDLRLSTSVEVKGMNGLSDMEIVSFDVRNGPTPDNLPTQMVLATIYNPSDLAAMPLGMLSGEATYQGTSLGWIHTVDPVSLVPGVNSVYLEGTLDPKDMTAMNDLFSRLMTGQSSQLKITFKNHTEVVSAKDGSLTDVRIPCTDVSLYEAGMNGFSAEVTLRWPGPRLNLTSENVVDASDITLQTTSIPLWVGILNPFSCDATLTDMEMMSFWDGSSDPSVPVSTVSSPKMHIPLAPIAYTLTGTTKATAIQASVDILNANTIKMTDVLMTTGWIFQGIRGTFTFQVGGGLTLTATYQQDINIPTCNLRYVQSNADGGVCSNPPTDEITNNRT